VEGVFAVRRKERRMSRKGSPYLALTLGDATGTISAVIFSTREGSILFDETTPAIPHMKKTLRPNPSTA
jgi:hypothetical protein